MNKNELSEHDKNILYIARENLGIAVRALKRRDVSSEIIETEIISHLKKLLEES